MKSGGRIRSAAPPCGSAAAPGTVQTTRSSRAAMLLDLGLNPNRLDPIS